MFLSQHIVSSVQIRPNLFHKQSSTVTLLSEHRPHLHRFHIHLSMLNIYKMILTSYFSLKQSDQTIIHMSVNGGEGVGRRVNWGKGFRYFDPHLSHIKELNTILCAVSLTIWNTRKQEKIARVQQNCLLKKYSIYNPLILIQVRSVRFVSEHSLSMAWISFARNTTCNIKYVCLVQKKRK